MSQPSILDLERATLLADLLLQNGQAETAGVMRALIAEARALRLVERAADRYAEAHHASKQAHTTVEGMLIPLEERDALFQASLDAQRVLLQVVASQRDARPRFDLDGALIDRSAEEEDVDRVALIRDQLHDAVPFIEFGEEFGWEVYTNEIPSNGVMEAKHGRECKPATERLIGTKMPHGQLKAPAPIVTQSSSPYFERKTWVSIDEKHARFIADAPGNIRFLLQAEQDARAVAYLAFVKGAKWWEFESTGGTMWQSDQARVRAEAERYYPYIPPSHIRVLEIERDAALKEVEVLRAALRASLEPGPSEAGEA